MRAEQALAYFKRRRDTMQLMEEDVAIWALEKQIPKKPIKDDDNMVCPMCGTIIGMSPYCAKCGQALDWGKRPINIRDHKDGSDGKRSDRPKKHSDHRENNRGACGRGENHM